MSVPAAQTAHSYQPTQLQPKAMSQHLHAQLQRPGGSGIGNLPPPSANGAPRSMVSSGGNPGASGQHSHHQMPGGAGQPMPGYQMPPHGQMAAPGYPALHQQHQQQQHLRGTNMAPVPSPYGMQQAGYGAPQIPQQVMQSHAAYQQYQAPIQYGSHQRDLNHPLFRLATCNEQVWLQIGIMSESMGNHDRAMQAFEAALRNNPYSVPALSRIAANCRAKEQFPRAVEYFQRILNVEGNNGEIWGALGHCYLILDDLPKAYAAYQQALYHLPNPKEPKLWYGIGILYDRYGSFDHAEEAFSSVIKMDPKFEKANEIYFRLGIIYKQQGKHELSLQCFRYILHSPPKPLTEVDIWFQIGHLYEMQKEFKLAKEAYDKVLNENPNHAKVLQQLGWLYHQPETSFTDKEGALTMLAKSVEIDAADPQSWYFLGRCHMDAQNYNKAYEAYQQAVYRDGRNPIFWCSIGLLYYKINQFRDSLDAYSRAIRLNPYISEVWFDLGILYESCNNQIQDAIDAYTRAAELSPNNSSIAQRLAHLKHRQANPDAPAPSSDSLPSPMIPDMSLVAAKGQQSGQAPGPAATPATAPGSRLPVEPTVGAVTSSAEKSNEMPRIAPPVADSHETAAATEGAQLEEKAPEINGANRAETLSDSTADAEDADQAAESTVRKDSSDDQEDDQEEKETASPTMTESPTPSTKELESGKKRSATKRTAGEAADTKRAASSPTSSTASKDKRARLQRSPASHSPPLRTSSRRASPVMADSSHSPTTDRSNASTPPARE